MSSRRSGAGSTRSARRHGAQRWVPMAPARGFAISPPSARSSPTPCSAGPTSSGSACSTAPAAPPMLRRSRSPASTACASRRRRYRGWRSSTGVTVEIEGRPADYRDVGDSLDDRGVHRRHRGRARLVRPRRDDQRRRSRAAVRRGVRGARERRLARAARGRGSLLAARTPPAVVAPADRGGTGADGVAVGAAADQPLPGRPVGRARRARRRDRAGAGVAASGRRAARARRARRARSAARRWPRGCAPTSSRGSAGWRRCGSSSSAGSSPTTWGSARRCRRWR